MMDLDFSDPLTPRVASTRARQARRDEYVMVALHALLSNPSISTVDAEEVARDAVNIANATLDLIDTGGGS